MGDKWPYKASTSVWAYYLPPLSVVGFPVCVLLPSTPKLQFSILFFAAACKKHIVMYYLGQEKALLPQ